MLHLKPHQPLPKEDLRLLSLKTVFDMPNNYFLSQSNFSNINYCFLLIGDSCQYWMDLQNQKLSSPYYPHSFFGDGDGCEWLIIAPEGNIISLEFEHFNVRKN